MKARLVLVNPERALQPPAMPMLIVENDGEIVLLNDGWAFPLESKTLEAVTAKEVRALLRIPKRERISLYLSSVRPLLFEDLMTEEALAWAQQWWNQEAAELCRTRPLAKAS